MPPTTSEALRQAYRLAAEAVGVPADTLDTALWEQDLEVVPRLVGDERHWRVILNGVDDSRVIDSDELLAELGILLLGNPEAIIGVRPADQSETAAFALLGEDGLAGLDERRMGQELLLRQEVAEALTAAIDRSDYLLSNVASPITLDELAVELDAIAVRLRELAVAAERPAVPVELRKICEQLDGTASSLDQLATSLAQTDAIIAGEQPLSPFFERDRPWGFRALNAKPDSLGRRPSTVLSNWQICALANRQTWDDDQPGIPYLEGLAGLPDLDSWESSRAAERRQAERALAIQQAAAREPCTTCGAAAGNPCVTRTGRVAEMFHRPRLAVGTAAVDRTGGDKTDEERDEP